MVASLTMPDDSGSHGASAGRVRLGNPVNAGGERPAGACRILMIGDVIGKPGRRISEADAWNHVAGYTCFNEGSVRDWQKHTGQFTPGKNFVETGAFGPWMVTADELPPNSVMSLTTRLNGQVMQQATTAMLIFSMPRLIAYCSTFVPLAIGDVIVTGTPGGVGARRNPPVFMKPGDVVEVEVDRIGTLRNVVAVG